jgi:hypothetical protein
LRHRQSPHQQHSGRRYSLLSQKCSSCCSTMYFAFWQSTFCCSKMKVSVKVTLAKRQRLEPQNRDRWCDTDVTANQFES